LGAINSLRIGWLGLQPEVLKWIDLLEVLKFDSLAKWIQMLGSSWLLKFGSLATLKQMSNLLALL
jgi:hypothetical protein